MNEETTSRFEPGQRVEWRSDDRIHTGVYAGPDEGIFASFSSVTTDDGDMLVKSYLLHPEGVLAAQDDELADLAWRARIRLIDVTSSRQTARSDESSEALLAPSVIAGISCARGLRARG